MTPGAQLAERKEKKEPVRAKKRKLRAALAGVGDISMMHRPGYVDNPDAELYAVCDIDEQKLRRHQREWNVPKAYTDYKELLADPDVDIVEILTPHHCHCGMVVAAAAAGKNVSVQKPMCNTLREADEMIEAARGAGVKLKIFENFVFYPPYVKAKELIEAGEIGEPLAVRFKLGTCMFGSRYYPLSVELWHLLEVEKGMGQAIFDDGYHKLSQAIDLFGDIGVVRGWVDRSFAYADMPGLLMWRYKDSDCLGTFDLGLSPNLYNKSKYFPADERIDITGTRGSIAITRCSAQMLDAPALTLVRDGRRILFDDLRADWLDSFVDSTRHFVKCVLDDGEPHLTAERGKKIVQFAYACIIAGRTGEEIRPEEITDSVILEQNPCARSCSEFKQS
jgi:predicted dehydrogenase